MRRFNLFVSTLLMSASVPALAHAEIGSPTGVGGIYVSFEGGYHQSNASPVAAQGDSTVTPGTVGDPSGAFAEAAGTTLSAADGSAGPGSASASAASLDWLGSGMPYSVRSNAYSGTESAFATPDGGSFISADHGGYGGVSIGYAFVRPALGVVSRIEIYGTGSFADESSTSFGALGMQGVNGSAVALAAVPLHDLEVNVTQSLSTKEFGFRLKTDRQVGPLAFALSVEPFYIRYNQETETNGVLLNPDNEASANRRSDVDADLFGAQIALESVVPLFDRVSLIGRGSAGVYGVTANGGFSSKFVVDATPFQDHVSDGGSRTGYRLGAEGGFRYVVNSTTWLSLTTSVDYLSDVPTAVLPREDGARAAHIAFDDLLDWRTGLRLTFATNGSR